MRDAGLYALYDERHIDTTQYVDQYCDDNMIENPLYDPSCSFSCEDEFITDPVCDYLRSERDRYLNQRRRRELVAGGSLPMPVASISLKYLEHLIQNVLRDNGKFCAFSDTFAVDGWYADCTGFDMSSADDANIEAWFLAKEDDRGDVDLNRTYWLQSPAVKKAATYNGVFTIGDLSGANENPFLLEIGHALRTDLRP